MQEKELSINKKNRNQIFNLVTKFTQKLLPFFWGYVFDPNIPLRFSKSASSPGIPFSKLVFNMSDSPLT